MNDVLSPTQSSVDDLPIYLTIAGSIESKQWEERVATWGTFKEVLAEHPEWATKNGPSYLPGKLAGTQRKKNAVEELYLLVLDSDRGDDLRQIVERIRALGYAAVAHSSYSHLSKETRIKFDDYKRHAGTGEVTAERAREYLINKKSFRPEILGDVTIVEAMRSTPDGIFIVAGHAPIQKGRIILPLAEPFVIVERMQVQRLTQREAQELWGSYLAVVAAKLGVHLDEACKDVSRAFYYAAHPPGAEYFFEDIRGRALDLTDFDEAVASLRAHKGEPGPEPRKRTQQKSDKQPGAGLERFAAKYGKTFLLADAIEAEAPENVRGRATAVEGIVVECPFDELHTNSGDANDKASFVMNAGVTDSGGFVWKCHHASCQGHDRLDFLGKAIADGWFGADVLDAAEYHLAVADPCAQALTASAALKKESSIEEKDGVFRLTVECDAKLVRAAVLQQFKDRTGLGVVEGRQILKDYEKKARAESRPNSSKPHFLWQTQFYDDIVARVGELLIAANDAGPRIFRMGGALVRLIQDPVTGTLLTEPVTQELMRQEISEISTWGRMDGETEKSIGCPREVADHLLSDPDLGMPPLAGIVDAPFFDEDGNLVTKPGYHAESFTYYHPRPGFEVPAVSASPSPDQIAEAKALLMEEIDGDFPFADGTPASRSSKAHALALKLEPFARQLIKGVTPIYLIQKPTPGTGATLFVNAFAQVAFGGPAVPQAEVHSPDELRKNLTATLMTGTGLYWIDNVHHKVDNASLALATTTEVWKDRVLGHSKTVVLPVRCSWIISGNNVELSSELARRSVLIRLDANVERPTERKDFRHPNLLGYARSNRGQLVWAGLILIQAWIAAGKPAGTEILASYEPWSQVIGGILNVADIEGFLENRDDLKEVAADEDGPIKSFVQLMYETFGTKSVPVSGPATGNFQWGRFSAGTLSHALLRTRPGFNDKREDTWPGLLGKTINKYKDRVFEISTPEGVRRVKLRADRNSGGAVKWLELLPP